MSAAQTAPPFFLRLAKKIAAFMPQLTPRGLRFFCALFVAAQAFALLDLALSFFGAPVDFLGVLAVLTLLLAPTIFLGEVLLLHWARQKAQIRAWQFERRLARNCPMLCPALAQLNVQIAAQSRLASWLLIEVRDNLPRHCQSLDARFFVRRADFLPANAAQAQYTICPTRRGLATFGGVDLRLFGRLGLCCVYHRVLPEAVLGSASVRVFAQFSRAKSLAPFLTRRAIDARQTPKGGRGQDFLQTRPYVVGDSPRRMDWRASARLLRLISKQYQEERDQRVLFLLDASSRMRQKNRENQSQESHLDCALSAALAIAGAALLQGDRVGLVSFSGLNDAVVAPQKGAQALRLLLNQSFAIEASMQTPDYMAAAQAALRLSPKRALVVLLTSTRSQSAGELMAAVDALRARHTVIVANLYEELLLAWRKTPPADFAQASVYHTVLDHLRTQERLNARLAALAGVYTVHCAPSQLEKKLAACYALARRRLEQR